MAKEKSNSKIISHESLINKYRPTKLKHVCGQKLAVESIKHMIETKRVPSVIMFTGQTGTGKTTLARLLARLVNGSDADTHDFNIGQDRGIDYIRQITELSKFKPRNNLKFLILDEVHALLKAGENALLKPLEEPPAHTIFILLTNNPQQVNERIINRCEVINLQQPQPKDLLKLVKRINKLEKFKLDQKVLERISKFARSQREAIQLLGLLSRYSKKSVKQVLSSMSLLKETEGNEIDIITALYKKDLIKITEFAYSIENWSSMVFNLVTVNSFILRIGIGDSTIPYWATTRYGGLSKKLYKGSASLRVQNCLLNLRSKVLEGNLDSHTVHTTILTNLFITEKH